MEKVILREDVGKLGKAGEVVKVSPGYARNYLIPRKLALPATPSALRAFELEQKARIKRDSRDQAEAATLAGQLSGITITIPRKVGESDVLYGSVTSMDIAEELLRQKFEVDRRKIQLDEPLKSLGEFDVPIKLHRAVTASVKVIVTKEETA
ncbi:MAG: 50S ribosomal protein L9 [Acidobacteria bacterium]|nr:50S ribosomal protein L9 [Acidobacteriota bacterium]MBI3657207.1 50S ribosomal protein L9 [Acidobacteriota bacterium]